MTPKLINIITYTLTTALAAETIHLELANPQPHDHVEAHATLTPPTSASQTSESLG